jgi:hypothetical protein
MSSVKTNKMLGLTADAAAGVVPAVLDVEATVGLEPLLEHAAARSTTAADAASARRCIAPVCDRIMR